MIGVEYRWTANRDIYRIQQHYLSISSRSYETVRQDINSAIRILQTYPLAGAKIRPKGRVRRIVSSKYRYSITYLAADDKIEIIGIFRYQNRNV